MWNAFIVASVVDLIAFSVVCFLLYKKRNKEVFLLEIKAENGSWETSLFKTMDGCKNAVVEDIKRRNSFGTQKATMDNADAFRIKLDVDDKLKWGSYEYSTLSNDEKVRTTVTYTVYRKIINR